MAEVEQMKIDGADERKPKMDGSDQKKKSLKRKRLEPSLYTGNPQEKEAKINAFRNEITSLVRFCRDLCLENRASLLENAEKVGCSSASLNCMIACLMEESDLPLSKLVDDIFEKVRGRIGNVEGVTRASVKSAVLMIGQRLCYGVSSADADLLEDEIECALWCWETRDLKLMPKSLRASVKVRRTCRKKIHERIAAVSAVISAMEKAEDHPDCLQELVKASEKLGKVLNEADIRMLMENMSQKTGAEMAEKEAKKEEKELIKQMEKNKREMEKNKREMEKAKKKMDKELQKEMLQSEKEQKRLYEEAQREERRREKEEIDLQKQLKKQQEEAEKEQKRKAKEEAELKKQLALKKQASLMEQFLKKNKTSSQHDTSLNKASMPMPSSIIAERICATVTADMDSVLAQNVGLEAEAIWKSHLNSWHCVGRTIRSKRKSHWGTRQKPKTELVKDLKLTTNSEMTCDEDTVVEKNVDGWVDSNTDSGVSQTDMERPNTRKRTQSMQLLQFDKSHRPAFYGVWPKKSQVVKACHPLARDPDIDYEIDSDEEWEEEEPGESLSDCDKEDDDENVEEPTKVEEEDESEDGFFVPDGYLSENEGVEVDDMESDELDQEERNLPECEKKVSELKPSEEFCTLLRRQKYLNNLTEHALKKNQPSIILNLVHEKTTLLPPEELTGTEKLEKMCLQTLCIRPFPDLPSIDISVHNDKIDEDVEALSKKPSTTPPPTVAAIPDSDLPQIISIIHSCPSGIGKIVESLQNIFPALPKSQLRNKVREISDFSENRWQVKKEIMSKLGLSISPERSSKKAKSIASFFTKRCLPPLCKTTMNMSETSPQPPQKRADTIAPAQDCAKNESR